MTGKKIFITGASSGIGFETAKQFAKQNIGNHLVLGARRLNKLIDLANELQTSHQATCSVFKLDVRKNEDCIHFIEKGTEKAGGIDVLINNAGLSLTLDHVLNQRAEDVHTMFETNVFGLLAITKLALPHMLKQNRGQIINIGSIAGYMPYEGGSAYCASKSAVRAITESLRLELLGKNIRVTNISPGMTETEFSLVRFSGDNEKARKVYDGVTPLTGADIAEIICFTANLPQHVNIDELIVRPLQQAGLKVHRNETPPQTTP